MASSFYFYFTERDRDGLQTSARLNKRRNKEERGKSRVLSCQDKLKVELSNGLTGLV